MADILVGAAEITRGDSTTEESPIGRGGGTAGWKQPSPPSKSAKTTATASEDRGTSASAAPLRAIAGWKLDQEWMKKEKPSITRLTDIHTNAILLYMDTERGVPRASERLTELLADRRRLREDQESWKRRVSAYFSSVRTLNSLSQEDLAQDLGVSQGYVSEIERGVRTPSDEVLTRMHSLVKEADGN